MTEIDKELFTAVTREIAPDKNVNDIALDVITAIEAWEMDKSITLADRRAVHTEAEAELLLKICNNVRDLHAMNEKTEHCNACFQHYPCPTIRALNGEIL